MTRLIPAPIRAALRLQPLAMAGAFVLALAWVGWAIYGQGDTDFVLLAASTLTAVIVGLCALSVSLTAIWIWARQRPRAGEPQLERAVDAHVEIETGHTLPRMAWWPVVQVDLDWVQPEAVQVDRLARGGLYLEHITPRARGRFPEITRRYTIQDIFGLCRVAFDLRAPARLRVAPALGQADLSTVPRDTAGDALPHPAGPPEGEYIEMRRYQPGDPVRFILWKAYARSRLLVVRTPERAVAPQPGAIACLVAGAHDEAAASLARMFVEQGLLGTDFEFHADGSRHPATTPAEAVEALITSASHRDQGGEVLARLLDEHTPTELNNCLIFAPPVAGPWLDQVAAFSARVPAPPVVILGIDGDLNREPPPATFLARLRRWLFAEAPADTSQATPLEEAPALHTRIASMGARPVILHRGSGRVVAPSQLIIESESASGLPAAATPARGGASP